MDCRSQGLQSVGFMPTQVRDARQTRGSICQCCQCRDGRGEFTDLRHVELDSLETAVRIADSAQVVRSLLGGCAHFLDDVADSVSWVRGRGWPVIDWWYAAGNESCGEEWCGVGKIWLDIPLPALDGSGVELPPDLAFVDGNSCQA